MMEASTLNPPAANVAPEDLTVEQLVALAEGGGDISEARASDALDELEARADDGVEEAKAALESLGADAEVAEGAEQEFDGVTPEPRARCRRRPTTTAPTSTCPTAWSCNCRAWRA
jgi:hypothetical protein